MGKPDELTRCGPYLEPVWTESEYQLWLLVTDERGEIVRRMFGPDGRPLSLDEKMRMRALEVEIDRLEALGRDRYLLYWAGFAH